MQPLSSLSAKWLYDSPVNSDVEAKLRRFLVENADKILGIQVCAYKDGKVIIDTAAGVLGINDDDPRPVQPDSLFPVFSATKGVTSGLVHWLVDKGKLKLDDNVANIWPEFGTNGKDQIKVNHILNHTAGLHNALAGISEVDDLSLFCDFSKCIKCIAAVAPETEPGCVQLNHYLSYGWLCGGIIELLCGMSDNHQLICYKFLYNDGNIVNIRGICITDSENEHASGKKFQDILEEAFVWPLNVEGEFYIGIPPGVESRLATLTIDEDELSLMAKILTPDHFTFMPSTFSFDVVSNLITISNTINVRRAILPAANGHFSARALARYYATLVDGGVVPPIHSSSLPPLGNHPHNPTSLSKKTTNGVVMTKVFNKSKEKVLDAFLGLGDYKDLIVPNGLFGLGFNKIKAINGSIIGFGHTGLGGSTGYCDISNRFAISVTLNKLSMGAFTGEIIHLICSELHLPILKGYKGSMEKNKKLVIN